MLAQLESIGVTCNIHKRTSINNIISFASIKSYKRQLTAHSEGICTGVFCLTDPVTGYFVILDCHCEHHHAANSNMKTSIVSILVLIGCSTPEAFINLRAPPLYKPEHFQSGIKPRFSSLETVTIPRAKSKLHGSSPYISQPPEVVGDDSASFSLSEQASQLKH